MTSQPSRFSWLSRFFGKGNRQPERWSVLQVEITSRCPLRCSFCPNKTLGKAWLHGDLPFEVYRDHIAPHLSRFDLAYLQGWGEPMLHPRLWEMIRLAKAAGSRVGFTTCGNLLDEANSARLLDEGIDILSISFAGATRATHEALRIGSDFHQLAASVERLAAKCKANGSAVRLELHFLMMRANIGELPAFVRLAAALGADEVVATNLAYTPTRELEAMRVFGAKPDAAHQSLVAEAQKEAVRLGLRFMAYPLTMDEDILECDAKPTETAFVNHLGQVTPCVYLGLSVQECAPRCFEGAEHPIAPVDFGNVRDGLLAAMQGATRATFVAAFQARKAFAYSTLAVSVASGMGDAVTLPAPPPACRHCYKLYGV